MDPSHVRESLSRHVAYLRARLQTMVAAPDTKDGALAHLKDCLVRLHELGQDPLVRILGLTQSEASVAWLALAFRSHPDIQRLAHRAAPDSGLGLTGERIQTLCSSDRWTDLATNGALMKLGVLEPVDSGEVHESLRTWIASLRILAWLNGDRTIDRELGRVVRVSPTSTEGLAFEACVFTQAREALCAKGAIIVATGAGGRGRRSLLAAAANEAGIELLEIDAKRLAKEPTALAKQLRISPASASCSQRLH